MMVDIDTQVLFDCLIHAFCLTICLGVIGSGGVLLDSKESKKFSGVLRDELCIMIMNYAVG